MTFRVPITGLGIVAPGASGVDAFRSLLGSGRSAIALVDRFDTAGLRGRKAGVVRDFNPREFIAPMKMRRMNTLSRLAVSAAKLAMRDAGMESLDPAAGVAIGTAFGAVQTSVDYMREYVEKGAALAPPQLFAESVANAPGSHIAIELGLRGFNVTVTQRESSALAAAMYAASQIGKGMVPAALIGGVEEVNEMIFSVLDRLGALSPGEEGTVRPFDRRRDGILPGEGSAILIAGAGPAVYGYLSGFGMARDTTATISDWGEDARAVAVAISAAIEDAGLRGGDIDAVYASANGNVRGDRLESRALQLVFGEAIPPVVAVKGSFGEYAAGGALQLAAALLAVRDQILHPTAGFEQADEGARIDVVRQPRPAALRHVLVNSLSAGGGIVSAVVSREGE
ncbi:MAG TPA: beta-ketoacyl synthase N-terminal-like domain-containing protein [Thermoanaerobaculia bacterium]|nr:beta-ketoacyl synthase N-terminal-like domain-containing protein [Thermoanaerobaculia bacterium]